MSFRKYHPLIKIVNSVLVDLPAPANISVKWNMGSLLGLILILQIIRGVVLSMRFSAHSDVSFDTLILITQDIGYGWLLRLVHSTGASFFFLIVYLHIGRGLYYGSYVYVTVWNIGCVILLLLIGTAFLGYVLPWGQISYWAATVITNLLTVIPFVGVSIVKWVWGQYAVGNPTLTRFFTLHYLLPFVILVMAIAHIFYLHSKGRRNPLGVSSSTYKVPFHYYFRAKDSFYYIIFLFAFCYVTLSYGYNLMDRENFIPANPYSTPLHIQPEWYFLFAYAILRAVPNKTGGILGLLFAVLFLFVPAIKGGSLLFRGMIFSPLSRFIYWSFCANFLFLTWLGRCPAASPYNEVALICTFIYFFLFSLVSLWSRLITFIYLRV